MPVNITKVRLEVLIEQQRLLDASIIESVHQLQRNKAVLHLFWLDNNRSSYASISAEIERVQKHLKLLQSEYITNLNTYFEIKDELEKNEAWRKPWMKEK